MNRRSLMIGATAAALCPSFGRAQTLWSGVALGADVTIALGGDAERARATLTRIRSLLDEIEQDFSLYRPGSNLSRLNAGQAVVPTAHMARVLSLCTQMHIATGGRFDPSVQPLWTALAQGRDPGAVRGLVGWRPLEVTEGLIRLSPGQSLTLNGIAQGYATDAVRALLQARGYRDLLVEVGEMAALGGPFRLALSDPDAGILGHFGLKNRALAVSSARATLIGGHPHLLSPHGDAPIWSTVAVEADSAAVADALSTGWSFLRPDQIARAKDRMPGVGRVWLVSPGGELQTIGA